MSCPIRIRIVEVYPQLDDSWGFVPIVYEEFTMPNPRGITDHLSPTHRRMMNILLDGEWHSRDEMHSCLSDEMASVENLRTRIYELRKILRDRGQGDIVTKRVGKNTHYRHINS